MAEAGAILPRSDAPKSRYRGWRWGDAGFADRFRKLCGEGASDVPLMRSRQTIVAHLRCRSTTMVIACMKTLAFFSEG
jgi:hypothetical protein